MSEPSRRRRDPEARRIAILDATAELILEIGVSAVTHRLIAARAGVPLGATTQYFTTLDELRSQALHHLVTEVDARVDGIRSTLASTASARRSSSAARRRGCSQSSSCRDSPTRAHSKPIEPSSPPPSTTLSCAPSRGAGRSG
ncbi:TetR/AcrR family transcriptional regulator [Microbacterium sp. nov. GSS16]|uniref:TetR/AcrR family transcriptional regulator n=1 Tax=Microbacterium sp. nov. GSS16 TaxID=3019890 RepID=UPI002306419C|nr:TetR family transcriptional regulator [Microbacterium sp. nov. GSS16]WCD93179.1 TetR family transcriptional regulator [Microbacterium sp. nov. GSS16]